jgi:drug/metabolite transporter (DMT)-like permease
MPVAAILLALASSAAWGVADFSGGLLSRRQPTLAVAVVSQAAGFVALLLVFGGRGGGLDDGAAAIGVAAGIGGAVGLASFYKALAVGTMSVVSPLVACSAIVPFALSLATGERPSAVAVAGAVLAIVGAVLASTEERRAPEPGRARAVVLAVVAAVALGLFTYFLGLGAREGDALSTLCGARVASLGLLVVLTLARRGPLLVTRRYAAPTAAVGLGDVSANALLAAAAGLGLLSLVSVLGSLFPLVTILLAYVALGERLTRAQVAGVTVALVGVAILTIG